MCDGQREGKSSDPFLENKNKCLIIIFISELFLSSLWWSPCPSQNIQSKPIRLPQKMRRPLIGQLKTTRSIPVTGAWLLIFYFNSTGVQRTPNAALHNRDGHVSYFYSEK